MISNPFTDPKWANKTVAIIDRYVGFVRDKTTRPVANIVRGIVFGIIATVAALLIIVLGLIGLARGLHEHQWRKVCSRGVDRSCKPGRTRANNYHIMGGVSGV